MQKWNTEFVFIDAQCLHYNLTVECVYTYTTYVPYIFTHFTGIKNVKRRI